MSAFFLPLLPAAGATALYKSPLHRCFLFDVLDLSEAGAARVLHSTAADRFRWRDRTEVAEEMVLTAGACSVKLDGSEETKSYAAGDSFSVPAKSSFDIEVTEVMDYICHYAA